VHLSANAFFILLLIDWIIVFLVFILVALFILIEWLILNDALQRSCISDCDCTRWLIFSNHDKSICTCDFEEIDWFLSCLQLIFSIVTKARRLSAPCAKKFAHKYDVIVKCFCEL
jgi:hypothetical protein